jgi:hypothetical protein
VVLMTFDNVRQYGVSLLASAGAASLVVGLALQPYWAYSLPSPSPSVSSRRRRYGTSASSTFRSPDFKESTIEICMLVSASTAGKTFDLRCEVREKMIGLRDERRRAEADVKTEARRTSALWLAYGAFASRVRSGRISAHPWGSSCASRTISCRPGSV